MEEKKFVGLEGLKHFWTKIEAKVIKIIEDQIAEIIAEAPEDLDTLKEIADWISTHEDSASAMNTAILANTEAISGKADTGHTHTKSQIIDFAHTHDDRYFTETEVTNKLAGKSDTGHTHTKSDVGLDKVDNTADSDKSVKYASSAGSVSWKNVTGKPAYITGSYSNGVLNLYTN